MEYNQITNFLDKFKKLINKKEELKKIVIKTISEEINYQVNEESIRVKGGIISIEGSPILKSEVMTKKEKILRELKIILPDNIFLDIK